MNKRDTLLALAIDECVGNLIDKSVTPEDIAANAAIMDCMVDIRDRMSKGGRMYSRYADLHALRYGSGRLP